MFRESFVHDECLTLHKTLRILDKSIDCEALKKFKEEIQGVVFIFST